MPIDLLADEPVDLLSEEPNIPSFSELSPEDQEQALQLVREQISQKYPNMPEWLRESILKLTPKDKSPNLESAAKGISAITGFVPAAAGGLLQGASIPIRGAAGLIPTEFTQRLAESPDLRSLFPEAEGAGQKSVQMAGELLGGGGLFGKLMQGAKGAAALARVPSALQKPLALGASGAIATPGGSIDRALGAGGALAIGGAGKLAGKVANKVEEKLPAFMRGLTSKSTAEELVQSVQKPHDLLQGTADKLYGEVRSAIKKRDINIPIKEEYLSKAREILPNTRATSKLIDRAKSGDYDAVHDLQSHLYKKGTKGLSSDDIALENQGEEILDLRSKINEDLENHLIQKGHADVAHVLRQGKKAYKQLMDTYYSPNLRKGISKMVQSDLRLVPENPEKLFSENSVPMKNFLEKHPGAVKHAQGIREKKKAMKNLDSLFKKTAGIGGATFIGKTIHDLFR